jgi:hypothetical protein
VQGYINAGFTLNDWPFATRGNTSCGIDALMPFSPPINLFNCYDYHNTWKEATQCLYM